jgi:hypothetical protein
MLLSIYLYIETKNKKLIGSILIPVTLLINGFANLTLTPNAEVKSISSSVTTNWLMMHVSMMLLLRYSNNGLIIMYSVLSNFNIKMLI